MSSAAQIIQNNNYNRYYLSVSSLQAVGKHHIGLFPGCLGVGLYTLESVPVNIVLSAPWFL